MHLERYGNDEVNGIEQGTTYVFPKLDGTNAQLWYEGAPVIGGETLEEKIVAEYVDTHLIDKVIAKISNDEGGWSSKFIPRLLQTVFYDLVNEEMWNIIKKYKNPKIDFAYLQRLTITKVKEMRRDIF